MSKPYLNYQQQIDKLVNEKGLIISDTEYAREMLTNMDYASETNVASDVTDSDEERFVYEWLRKNFTPVQYRRFRLFMEGNSIREVARREGADYSSVNESIKAARKN